MHSLNIKGSIVTAKFLCSKLSNLLFYCFFFLKIVAAVADGMKAWDTLKEKSNNIDLVLTEVELPFMSGFGLLTMIMEHNICKNIPVISTIFALVVSFLNSLIIT